MTVGDLWDVIDLFWMCHSRVPGMEGESITRHTLPFDGSMMDQPNWIMWAFSIVEDEFHRYQAAQKGERQRALQTQKLQAEMKKRGG